MDLIRFSEFGKVFPETGKQTGSHLFLKYESSIMIESVELLKIRKRSLLPK